MGMILFVLPFILLLIAGPISNLVLMTSYCHGWVTVLIVFIMLSNWFVLRIMFKEKLKRIIVSLYSLKKAEKYSKTVKEKEAEGREQLKVMFMTAIFTAWISPCSVMSNNMTHKSKFLIVSSTICTFGHIVGIISVGMIAKNIDLSQMSSPPIFHCFPAGMHNYSEK